jgi:ribose-phosphate pyrophosphokinase
MIRVDGQLIHFGKFPNGESNLKHIKLDERDLTHVVTLKYEGDEDLFHLLLVKAELKVPATLRILYAPYSRMDRESDTYLFSLKVFTKFINDMGWEKVVIYEPHSDVLPALLDRVQVVDVTASNVMQDEVQVAVRKIGALDYQICYPDVGAHKRYGEKFGKGPPLIGFKTRDFETGKIKSLDIQGNRLIDGVVIVDDLCSKGGTFVLTATKLREMGFTKIVLAVAHCEDTVYDGVVFSSGLIDHVITTDSIISRNDFPDKLTILSMNQFKWNLEATQ